MMIVMSDWNVIVRYRLWFLRRSYCFCDVYFLIDTEEEMESKELLVCRRQESFDGKERKTQLYPFFLSTTTSLLQQRYCWFKHNDYFRVWTLSSSDVSSGNQSRHRYAFESTTSLWRTRGKHSHKIGFFSFIEKWEILTRDSLQKGKWQKMRSRDSISILSTSFVALKDSLISNDTHSSKVL
jgi:hypothetical protein